MADSLASLAQRLRDIASEVESFSSEEDTEAEVEPQESAPITSSKGSASGKMNSAVAAMQKYMK